MAGPSPKGDCMYYRRPRREMQSAEEFYGEYVLGWALVACAIGVVAFMLGMVGFAFYAADRQTKYDEAVQRQDHFAHLFAVDLKHPQPPTPAVRAYRQSVARNLLAEKPADDDAWLSPLLTRSELRYIVATGQAPKLAVRETPTSMSVYFNWALEWELPFGLLAIYLAGCLEFAFRSLDSNYQLVELPWDKRWIWPFFVATLPVLGPCYLGSYVRGRYFEEMEDEPRVVPAPPPITEEERASSELPSRRQTDAQALVAYVELRQTGLRRHLEERKSRVTRSIEYKRRDLEALGARITETQQTIARFRNDLAEAEDALEDLEATAPSNEDYAAEYRRLRELPYVVWVDVESTRIRILLHRLTWYDAANGNRYDLGDYILMLSAGEYDDVRLECVRQAGRREGLIYGLNNFCFGSAASDIKGYLSTGEYLPAVTTIIRGLTHVNPEDEADARSRYPKVN